MRERKPCRRLRTSLLGWYVRFTFNPRQSRTDVQIMEADSWIGELFNFPTRQRPVRAIRVTGGMAYKEGAVSSQ